MTIENKKALPLSGYHFFPHPTEKTLGVLRIDTLQGHQSWFLVTKKNLLLLSEALAKHAQELDQLQ